MSWHEVLPWLLALIVCINIFVLMSLILMIRRVREALKDAKYHRSKAELVHRFLVETLGPQLGVDIEIKMKEQGAGIMLEAGMRKAEAGKRFGLPPRSQLFD